MPEPLVEQADKTLLVDKYFFNRSLKERRKRELLSLSSHSRLYNHSVSREQQERKDTDPRDKSLTTFTNLGRSFSKGLKDQHNLSNTLLQLQRPRSAQSEQNGFAKQRDREF